MFKNLGPGQIILHQWYSMSFGVCQNLLNIVAPKCLNGTMVEYLGKVHALLYDFNELLSPASNPSQELKQRSKLFMFLALHGLLNDYSHVCD